MGFMHQRKMIRTIDADRIKAAIEEAERRTSGEIRVSVSRFFWGKIEPVAWRAFIRLGMNATKGRNGILFFIVPARRKFVVIGDEGIHAHVGREFWEGVAAAMSENFKKGRFSEGLVQGIAEVGRRLAVHFPYDAATDKNELSDEIDYGKSK
ncbi:MAG: TPM domain-containing protein [Candidatus Aminicenantales bacterium]|jgi:uncharacterized membrane protein